MYNKLEQTYKVNAKYKSVRIYVVKPMMGMRQILPQIK